MVLQGFVVQMQSNNTYKHCILIVRMLHVLITMYLFYVYLF